MTRLPTGTVTFLFSDIEGSTELVQTLGARYRDVLARHARVVREAVERAGGHEVSTEGDSFFVVFRSAPAAVRAAVEVQLRLAEEPWPEDGPVRVRMGLHTGEGELGGDDYAGLDVNRAARVASAAHGGQILISMATANLVEGDLPTGVALRDLGEHRLKDLRRPEHIFQIDVPGQRTKFPPLRSLGAQQVHLPRQRTSFVGREDELASVETLLHDGALLTLTGPGGAGKTRLAVRLAERVSEQFEHGVFFVDLSPITDPDLVAVTIARSLGLPESRGENRTARDRIVEHLRDREVLLVLDNFEQVLDATPLVADLVEASPRSRLLVTSRAVLNVYGERDHPVPPLRLPDPDRLPDLETLSQYEAVRLFIDRATAVKPSFAVTNDNAPAVAEICVRLDGLPLAIELAAARVRVLTPDAILDRLTDRLSLLVGGARDLPARQRTLRQAIAWSHDLLEAEERRLMSRLAVFVGGFTLEEAEEVCGPPNELAMEVFEGLTTLVDNSLLVTSSEDPAVPRFRMLETIRDFAFERLAEDGEEEPLRRRHAGTFLTLAESAAGEVYGPRRREMLDRLEREHDNLRAALTWAIDRQETSVALRLVRALWRLWQMRGYLREGRRYAEWALTLPDVEEHPRELIGALEAAGGLAHWQMDNDGQQAHYEHALAVARQLGDDRAIAHALFDLSFPVYFRVLIREDGKGLLPPPDGPSPVDDVRAMWEEALGLYRAAGDDHGTALIRWMRGFDRAMSGDLQAAQEDLGFAMSTFEAAEDVFMTAWTHYGLANVADLSGDYEAARDGFTETLRLFAEAGDTTGVVFQLELLAKVEATSGDRQRAARLAGAATALRSESGTLLLSGFIDGVPLPEDLVRDDITAAAFEEGRRMRLEDAVSYALDGVELTRVRS